MDFNIQDMFTAYETVNSHIEKEIKRRTDLAAKPRYQSESIDKIAEALSAAQGEYPCIPFNRKTEMWSNEYSDFDTLMKHIFPILSKYQISFTQRTEVVEDNVMLLRSVVMHTSNQWLSSCIRVNPPRNDIECLDSTLIDLKREQAKIILGISLEGDVRDDDGEDAMRYVEQERKQGTKQSVNRKQESYQAISKEQAKNLTMNLMDLKISQKKYSRSLNSEN